MKLKICIFTLFCASCGQRKNENKSNTLKAILPSHEYLETRLGGGINVDSGELFNSCVDFDPSQVVSADGFGANAAPQAMINGNFTMKLITSYLDVDELTQTRAEGGVKSAYASGRFQYSRDTAHHLTSDSVAVGIKAIADYGRFYLKSTKLKAEYAELAKKDIEEFYRRCGHEYVSGYRLGQGVLALMSTDKESVYNYDKISTSISASGGGVVKGDFSASFLAMSKQLSEVGLLHVQLNILGGSKLSEYSSFISSESDMTSLKQKLATIVENMKPDQAAKIAYYTSKYEFPVAQIGDEYDHRISEYKNLVLKQLYADFRLYSDQLVKLNDAIRDMDKYLDSWSNICKTESEKKECRAYFDYLEKQHEAIDTILKSIATKTEQCVKAKDSKGCDVLSADEQKNALVFKMNWPKQYYKLKYVAFIQRIKDRKIEN